MILFESVMLTKQDIYYNKDKFDNGEINLCFITGHSGSGKTTMGYALEKSHKAEHYQLDDVLANWDFSDNNLKEYGDLIYSFFTSIGKKYRYRTRQEWLDDKKWDNKNANLDSYEAELTKRFVEYAIAYAGVHKEKRIVIEGVWLFQYFNPEFFKEYAFYIKGTSMLISKIRGIKRDMSNYDNTHERMLAVSDGLFSKWQCYFLDEKRLNKFYKYYSHLKNE